MIRINQENKRFYYRRPQIPGALGEIVATTIAESAYMRGEEFFDGILRKHHSVKLSHLSPVTGKAVYRDDEKHLDTAEDLLKSQGFKKEPLPVEKS